MVEIRKVIVFKEIDETIPDNWENISNNPNGLKRKYKEKAGSFGKPDDLVVYIPDVDHPFRVHLKPGNDFSYTLLNSYKNHALLEGKNVEAYTDNPHA